MTTKFRFLLKISYYFILFLIFMASWKGFIVILLLQVLWRRFYKVRRAGPEMILKYRRGQYFSPVHGKIVEIIQDDHRTVLKIRIGLFAHKALVLILV